MKQYKVIGIMSGTSLDGLDIAFCIFKKNKTGKWKYKILQVRTIKYFPVWKNKLRTAHKLSAVQLVALHTEYGHFIGKEVRKFIQRNNIFPDFISSHGHTVFHQPEKRFTFQIGDGTAISAECNLPVVFDFRSGDVALGGQGAPLVPIADKFLFADYDYCLNLGGIANISYDNEQKSRIAYDICPANIVLNYLSGLNGKEFDEDGKMAASGSINSSLLNQLNMLSFYKLGPPKSLGREWIEKEFFPVLQKSRISLHDKLRTVTEHIAVQIGLQLKLKENSTLLITGGGACNKFLVKLIKQKTAATVEIPHQKIIKFKEALAFAFLGLLRIQGENNILKSVTGAKKNNSGGNVVSI